MPSYIEEPEAAACKWVSIRERDREKYDQPTVFSILIYMHPKTGFPLAICDGSYHTVMRTGAAAAVSAKWKARKDSKAARYCRRAEAFLGSADIIADEGLKRERAPARLKVAAIFHDPRTRLGWKQNIAT